MIDEVADVGSPEIHAKSDARIGALAAPVGDVDHVAVLAVEAGLPSLCDHEEVNLVDVELVIFARAIFDGPVFHRALRGDDGRRIVGVEEFGRCAVDRDEEIGGAVGVGRDRRRTSEKYSLRLRTGAASDEAIESPAGDGRR